MPNSCLEAALNIENSGAFDLMCIWGLSARDLGVEDGDLYRLMVELDKVKGPFMQLLRDVEEAAQGVIRAHGV